jgi:hypothetical protein
VKLRSLALLAVGYVAGSRAGRARYRQIVDVTRRLGDALDRYARGDSSDREAGHHAPMAASSMETPSGWPGDGGTDVRTVEEAIMGTEGDGGSAESGSPPLGVTR